MVTAALHIPLLANIQQITTKLKVKFNIGFVSDGDE